MTAIIPKSKAKGIDICGEGGCFYIIRSDLGCYMETSDLNKGSDISIFSLHPSLQNGDHYLGGGGRDYFYIIKGDSFCKVADLSTDIDAEVQSLHPNCQGGDHYFSAGSYFFIIFQEKGTYRTTVDLQRNTEGSEHTLHPNCRNGLYYWGISGYCCFLKPASEWGVKFCRSNDASEDQGLESEPTADYSVHSDVLNFLPGGLSVTQGPSFGRWENIKTITNDSTTTVNWQKKINRKVGYTKEKMTEITHNWKIAASASIESGVLASLIAKFQLSFSAEYGGSHVNTESESWNEVIEEEEQLSFELKPNQSVYLWQYHLGLGKEPVLFCRDIKIDDVPTPPTEVPLPPAQP